MVVEKVFAVIAESTRREILEALAQESKAVGQLVDELGVSQPTVSKHLRVLREAGVVTMRAQGQKRYYGINTEPLKLVSTWLESLGAGMVDGASVGAVVIETVPLNGALTAPVAGKSHGATTGATSTSAQRSTPVSTVPARPAAKAVGSAEPSAPVVAAPSAASVTKVPSGARAAVEPTRPVVAAGSASTAPASVTLTPTMKSAASNGSAAPKVPAGKSNPVAVWQAPALSSTPSSENDGGVPRQLGRSVGRAAKKGADLLATFKRRKD